MWIRRKRRRRRSKKRIGIACIHGPNTWTNRQIILASVQVNNRMFKYVMYQLKFFSLHKACYSSLACNLVHFSYRCWCLLCALETIFEVHIVRGIKVLCYITGCLSRTRVSFDFLKLLALFVSKNPKWIVFARNSLAHGYYTLAFNAFNF